LSAEEEIILNVNEMSEGYDVYRLFQYIVSPDNNIVAYLVDTSGDRRNTLFFKNLQTGEILPDQVSNCSYSGAWSSDNQYFFYTQNDKTVRSYQVKRHQLGTSIDNDPTIFTEADSTYSVGLYKSSDRNHIFVGSFSTNTSEVWFINANEPNADLAPIQVRKEGLEYNVNSYGGEPIFYIRNNDQALNFKISTVDINNPGLENWKDLVPHQETVLINGFEVTEKYLIVQERTNAVDQIRVIDRSNNQSSYVDFGEEVYSASMYKPTDEFDSDSIRYTYTSLTTPNSIFGYNLTTQAKKLLKQAKVGGGFDGKKYGTERIWVTATDGTQVPMSIVFRKDRFEKNGGNPCLLYSYGSYGASSMPYFNSNVISLLDRGFVYAIAHIRGGQEMGRKWYEEGRLMNKKNTFTDFIDCAEHLVEEQYTSKDLLFASGTSAGGMLMGAITNMRPDLFKGIIARVPWMDVITDMSNPDLPLTTLEYDEWGDPNEKEAFDYMLSWSPYDNVQPADYPAILATGGLNDTQVPYFSPAKWVQKIRDNNTGDEPVLFKCEMGAGHGGASGRFERQKEWAMIYAFMIDQVARKVKD
jgi:oligopeptidase B